MKKLTILVLTLLILLNGCATPKFNYSPQVIALSEPPIGVTSNVSVGDVMLRQGKYTEHDALYLSKNASIGWAYTLMPGFYLKTGNDDTGEYYLPDRGQQGGGVNKAAFADPWKSIMTKKDNQLCVVTVFNVSSCATDQAFERQKRSSLTQDSFQQTLIYSGKIGNKINIGYREFSNNMARPAFNNNVEYDLSESKIIGYKGAQIEIFEATNQYVKYKIIKNFNAANF